MLANCYYEIEDYKQAHSVIKEFIVDNLENNLLQKLWGKINLELGNESVALDCFKKLLFLFPGDNEISELIENLELNNQAAEMNIKLKKILQPYFLQRDTPPTYSLMHKFVYGKCRVDIWPG